MISKKYLLLGIGVVGVVAAALYLVLRASAETPEHRDALAASPQASSLPITSPPALAPSTTSAPPASAVGIDRLSYNTQSFKAVPLSQRLTAMSARRPGRVFNAEEVAAALQSDVAWTVDPQAVNHLSLSKDEQRDGREFIRINPLKIEALMPGDEMSVPIHQLKLDGSLRMVVDSVEDGGMGNMTWHGHLKDFPSENQVSFTRGDSLIVGGVTGPDKNYVIQINGDVGWVADGFTLFKGKHDAIKPGHDGGTPPVESPHTN